MLDNLKRAIAERDSLHYAAQLGDAFEFVFAPQDTGGAGHYPATWGRADEIIAMSRLFRGATNADGYASKSIFLTWERGFPDTTAEYPTWTRIVASNVFLTVTSRHFQTEDPLDYLVQGDQAAMWFEKSGSQWALVRWRDMPIRLYTIQPSTFGQIKRLWR